MVLILDDIIDNELKEYLLTQEGVIDVNVINKDFIAEIDIKFDKRITPQIIMKYIELFQGNEYEMMIEFDKENEGNFKKIKYIVDDVCCEYCYKSLIRELFENKFIKSVKTNFDIHKPFLNMKFFIEYDEDYSKDKLIEYIKEKKGL